MVSLVGHTSNYWVYLFSILITIVWIEAFDLAGKFRLHNSYSKLPLVSDVKPEYVCSDARFF
jgi:hypothetical protein